MHFPGHGANMIQKSTMASPKNLVRLRPISTKSWYQIAYLFSPAASDAGWHGNAKCGSSVSYAIIMPERVGPTDLVATP